MHDVIAQKISEINGNKSNKTDLEDIITKLVDYVPKSVIKARIFRSAKTIQENLEIIEKNALKYNINIYKFMGLNLQLMAQYINSSDIYNARKLANWFNKNEQQGNFKLWLMNNDEKYVYANFFGLIGGYYRRYLNPKTAIEYYTRAKEIYDDVKGYDTLRCGVFFGLAMSNIELGKIQEAEKNIYIMEQMVTNDLVDKTDMGKLYFCKAKLFFVYGKYYESLEQINKTIETCIKNGLKLTDLFLTNYYILKAEILNSLGKYQEAHSQTRQLYDMHKSSKKEDHEIFGRIFIQMARSELGFGKLDHALDHVNKATTIFLADEHKNPKDGDYSEDPNLAMSYVVQGDVLFAQDNVKEAIKSYNKAYTIYHYLYKDNRKNVAQVSYLYTQGAKAACKARDLHSYKFFGKQQVKEFGVAHSNTVSMFEYCKGYNMDLWVKEN